MRSPLVLIGKFWGIGFDPFNGRDGQIRTADPSHPKRVLYQAEPRPDNGNFLT
jgi:hypothetical protein